MKIISWIQLLCAVYSFYAEASTLESTKNENKVDADTELSEGLQPLNEEQPETMKFGPSDDTKQSVRLTLNRPCPIWTYKTYIQKLKDLGLTKFPYMKIIKSTRYRVKYGRPYVVKSYTCPKRIAKRALYDLCQPCNKQTEHIIHPSIPVLATFNEVDCNGKECIRFKTPQGNTFLGKCVEFPYEFSVPVPADKNCNKLVQKTFKVKAVCVCKVYDSALLGK